MRRYFWLLIATTCLVICNQQARANVPQDTRSDDRQPTPVGGESWLNHLRRSYGDTSMGKTGRLGPPAPEPGAHMPPPEKLILLPVDSGAAVTLHGSDLYRLNCQGCHGEAGLGAPPEINSIINPVRAASARIVMERMKSNGMDISSAAAAELAKQSKVALLQRLHNGGENMPPFPHLSETEIRLLLPYLNHLAGVTTGSSESGTVTESALRVGEHIVKSTCHTCHGATGPNPNAQELEDGAIPPLQTLTARVNQAAFIRKVTSGAPIVMGTPPTPHRGRMPVFDYLSQDEAADVYLYLTTYLPSDDPRSDTAIALSQTNGNSGEPPAAGGGRRDFSTASGQLPASPKPTQTAGPDAALLLGGVIMFMIALLAYGALFTRREFKRLCARAQNLRTPVITNRSRSKMVALPSLVEAERKCS